MPSEKSVSQLVEELELPFNDLGIDPYGVSKKHLKVFFKTLSFFYKTYFRVKAVGAERIPSRGRAMLVGNHSGGYAIDGAMVLTSMLLELNPPRLAHSMAEKFLNALPVSSLWSNRCGQFTGLPEHAERLLHDNRLLMVFPEGARGTAKLHKERYSLVDFGTGFMRLALKTKTPIVPFGFIGGGDAVPTIYNSKTLGKLMGVPYVPFTAYGFAAPLPVKCEVHYGAPMVFEGDGNEDDAVIKGFVSEVKKAIAGLMEEARTSRGGVL
jgi:1-acyl-sn-glycerol-3-phosphate acyltransferase